MSSTPTRAASFPKCVYNFCQISFDNLPTTCYDLSMFKQIGFTGTRYGMTDAQKSFVENIMKLVAGEELHHGDCVGADEDSHYIARLLGMKIILHPPEKTGLRAYCKADEERKPKGYIARDHDIVDEVELLIATPNKKKEVLRSGTWATIRYARKTGKHILIIYPDGEYVVELGQP